MGSLSEDSLAERPLCWWVADLDPCPFSKRGGEGSVSLPGARIFHRNGT